MDGPYDLELSAGGGLDLEPDLEASSLSVSFEKALYMLPCRYLQLQAEVYSNLIICIPRRP